MNNISVTLKLSQQQYIRAVIYLNYRRFRAYHTHLIGLIFITYTLFMFELSSEIELFNLVIGLLLFLFNPISLYFGARKMYRLPQSRISEALTYTFTSEQLSIKGETFTSEMTWSKLYKVVETKNWMLIYQNKGMANVLPKSAISAELPEIRRIIGLTGIKYKK